ncbi:type I restriction endonuclease subunit R [Chitinophaga cymbidii]|uniref:Type I restriction enzyme endonuclease subunit n=1 Tax=Chitinophaga cymbidii TaxID=1096750 RepID=A0A512RM71_9BACT|nr:HsdR family type I site-specific deoxyribonuclease [Chitinophaga cymbidii]GEP96760.1 DEAD/DEAH box helicase [Chitinophaga cymbidii]
MSTPSLKETHISQIPALQLLMKLGYRYLTPEEALEARGGRNANVLLESILKEQLKKINKIEYKGREFPFDDANINNGIVALRDLPVYEGFISANQAFYNLVTLGKSLEQTILGDKKSFTFRYIDWEHPENNVYHVTDEFDVTRTGRKDTYRSDIVLFINGIPMVVIECKSPKLKEPVDKAIEQHARNQQEDGIRSLYHYSNLLISTAVNDGRYGTTNTHKKFWGVWKEKYRTAEAREQDPAKLLQLKNAPLPDNERTVLFKDRYRDVLPYFTELEQQEVAVTAQDELLYHLCNRHRLLDLMYNFILYDDGEKKIARYQQYFSVRKIIDRITRKQPDGTRQGGVLWHTQGSGKSLTMVMLAQLIANHPAIKNPRLLLVSDRLELDEQIKETFKKCKKPVRQATTGRHLVELLEDKDDAIITTIINKFENAVKIAEPFTSPDIFVLVDEGHRSQYGAFNVNMQRVFPNACFIAFTGTPLLKAERNTASKFGGLIDIYAINDAVKDGAVVPLLYEGRHNLMDVNAKPLDEYFDIVSEDVSDYGKANAKRKFSARNKIVQSINFIDNTAKDIFLHFRDHIQATGFKAQLVAPTKLAAVRYRDAFKALGKVSVDVVISPPDDREGEEDAFEESDDQIKKFWKAMMGRYGTPDKYEKNIVHNFKYRDQPEIIIVVDKLLTGFDAPVNQVLYLTRSLKEHTLLQAIARVNRLAPGKDHGLIVDYFGNLENLDGALKMYANDDTLIDDIDLGDTLVDIAKELLQLPQAHSGLKEIFKDVRNKLDSEAYEVLLGDEAIRYEFYKKLSLFTRLLKLALASVTFIRDTPAQVVDTYKNDLAFFLGLRASVMRRYSDELNYSEYEAQVQKLIDKHITTDGEVLKITGPVNIFDKEKREAELERITGKAAKADHIASRTARAISIKMNDDQVFYKRLSELILQTIDDYRQHRIDEAEYLARMMQRESEFFAGHGNDVPEELLDNANAIAYYNLVSEELKEILKQERDSVGIAVAIALGIDNVVNDNIYDNGKPVIDWYKNEDVKGKIRIEIDDLLFDFTDKYKFDPDLERFDYLIDESIKIAESKHR